MGPEGRGLLSFLFVSAPGGLSVCVRSYADSGQVVWDETGPGTRCRVGRPLSVPCQSFLLSWGLRSAPILPRRVGVTWDGAV